MISTGAQAANRGSGWSLTHTASKAAQVVAADDDARLRVGRMSELAEPVLVLQDAAEYSLVVAKKYEGGQATDCDTILEGLPPSKPGTHFSFPPRKVDRDRKYRNDSLEMIRGGNWFSHGTIPEMVSPLTAILNAFMCPAPRFGMHAT